MKISSLIKLISSIMLISLVSFQSLNAAIYYITSDNSDAEERISNGDMYLDSSDLEMAWDGHLQLVGLRFNAVNIPVGSTIDSAKILFRSDANDNDNISLIISGELSNDATAFSSNDFDLSSRTKTTATVTWDPPRWQNNTNYETVDISPIIQEIVNQAGYAGDDLVIFIEPGSGCTNSDCRRRADSRDTSTSNAPRLEVTFSSSSPPIMGDITNQTIDTNQLYSFSVSDFASPTTNPISSYTLSGSLPTGLSFNTSSGLISGTPTATGTFNLSASATDADGESNYDDFFIIVLAESPPTMGNIINQTTTNGSLFSLDISSFVTQTNGDEITTYSLTGTLPNGLIFNSSTGIISGSATETGTFNLSVTASDDDGESNSQSFTVTVEDFSSICYDYDANNESCNTIDFLNNVSSYTTGCIEGSTSNSDTNKEDYYQFTAGADGMLDITTLSPNYHEYYMRVGSSCGGTQHYGESTASNHNIPSISLNNGETVYFYFKETGSDTDQYQVNFQFNTGDVIAVNDIVSTSPNQNSTFNLISNDYTADSTTILGNTLLNSYPSHGTIINNNDGTVTYTPNAGYIGNDTFTYTVENDSGTVSNVAIVNITIGYVAGGREFLVRNPLETRNIRGNYEIAGNVNLCRYASNSNTAPWGIKGLDTNSDGISDNCHSSGSTSNSYPASFVDIDGDASTINSSSFNLDLPANSEVVWAGLYWQGVVHNTMVSGDFMDGTLDVVGAERLSSNEGINLAASNNGHGNYDADKVKFKIPGGNYQELTAQELDFDDLGYAGFKDVTSLINKTNPNGIYTVADIKSHQGIETNHGNYAAWSLVVIYENANEEFRNISLFDGFATVDRSFNEDLVIDGFLTPKEGDISSKLAYFTMDGDGGSQSMDIINQAGSTTAVDDGLPGAPFNSSILIPDEANRIPRNPSLRMDLDIIDLQNVLNNLDTSVTLQPRSGGDRYTASFFIMSSDLYAPKLCYDYSYSQYGRYITEENNGTQEPRLDPKHGGSVGTNEAIDLRIYVKNTEPSDTLATDVKLSLLNIGDCDIGNCQAEYVLGSTEVSAINSSELLPRADINATSTYAADVSIDDIDSESFFYTSFDILPLVNDINMSINARLDYKLQLYDNLGNPLLPNPLSYKQFLNKKIPLCNENGYSYSPNPYELNVVHDYFYNNFTEGEVGGTYNLPTQVVNRNGNFHVIATDADTTLTGNENMDLLKSTTTVAGIEIIDAGGWQDADTSCNEDDTRRSHIVWVGFDDSQTNVILNDSVFNGISPYFIFTEHPDAGTFKDVAPFSIAIESAAFRLSSFIPNGDINPDFRKGSVEGWYLENFTDYAGTECSSDPNPNNPVSSQEIVSQYCGDNSGRGIADFDLCIKCIMGGRIKRTCSRDNFAIRPEAFLLSMQDQNQSDLAATPKPAVLESDVTGVASPASPTPIAHLAAGYQYFITATAVDHIDNNASYGYTNSFSDTVDETGGFIYTWDSTIVTNANCNDTNNSDMNFNFATAGLGSINHSMDEVGTYTLSMLDTTWTTVDQNPSHHISANNFSTGAYQDCIQNVSTVPNKSSANLSGCNISSDHNVSGGLSYRNPRVEFHPYKFNMTGITPSLGLNNDTVFTGNPFLYMADISENPEISYKLNGTIAAVGYNGSTLSNFVNGCYAEPINLDLNTSGASGAVPLQFRFINTDNIGILDTNATNFTDGNNTTINLSGVDFNKSNNSTINTNLHINFDRDQSIFMNPERVTFTTYASECTTPANCTIKADLGTRVIDGNRTLDHNITHYYGKSHAGRKRYEIGTDGPPYPANIYFEVFCFGTINGNTCDPSLLPSTQRTDDSRWYINSEHNASRDGFIQNIRQAGGLSVVTGTTPSTTTSNPAVTNLTLNPTSPYKTTMEINASKWLIYNKDDNSTDVNQFPVEFEISSVGWAGEHETNTTTQGPGTVKTNRRSMW